jgi:hypothetical protein
MNPHKIRKRTEPAFIEPMQCKAVTMLRTDEKLIFEIKFDGWVNRSLRHWTMVMFQSQFGGFAARPGKSWLQAARNSWRRAELNPPSLVCSL